MYWPVAKEIWYDLTIALFLALVAMLFSQAKPSNQFFEGSMRIISIKLLWFWTSGSKIFLIYSSSNSFFGWSKPICAFLVEGIMRYISLKLFWMWISGSVEDVIKRYLSFRALATPVLNLENCLCNFGKSHHEESFREIILNLYQWFRRKCHWKTFLI